VPLFLTLDDVLESHAEQIAAYGGSDGIRDVGMLLSAVAQPESTFDVRRAVLACGPV